jgi:hypothetical protein
VSAFAFFGGSIFLAGVGWDSFQEKPGFAGLHCFGVSLAAAEKNPLRAGRRAFDACESEREDRRKRVHCRKAAFFAAVQDKVQSACAQGCLQAAGAEEQGRRRKNKLFPQCAAIGQKTAFQIQPDFFWQPAVPTNFILIPHSSRLINR